MPSMSDIGKMVRVFNLVEAKYYIGTVLDVKNKGHVIQLFHIYNGSKLIDTECDGDIWTAVEILNIIPAEIGGLPN